jgi:hypothetical protein
MTCSSYKTYAPSSRIAISRLICCIYPLQIRADDLLMSGVSVSGDGNVQCGAS